MAQEIRREDVQRVMADGGQLVEVLPRAQYDDEHTLRPHVPPQDAAETLKHHRRDYVLITTSDGQLVGLLRRADLEAHIAERRADDAAVSG